MKPKHHKLTAILPFLLLALLCLSISFPTEVQAQGLDRWLGPTSWWDWSDYRFIAKYRVMFPKLLSGTVTRLNREGRSLEIDLLRPSGYNFDPNPSPFSEGWFQLQIDRLGLRFIVEEDRSFRGMVGNDAGNVATVDPWRLSTIDISSTRLGLDLDILRYPFFRAGINFDYSLNGVEFNDFAYATRGPDPKTGTGNVFLNVRDLVSGEPITIGLQATAIPGRIKEVPIIMNARVRVSMPFMKEVFGYSYTTRLTDWEVSAGLRPSVWDTSAYKFATFSLGVEGGYRSTSVDAEFTNSTSVRYKFGGLFMQVGIYY